MKKLILILPALLWASSIYADTSAKDGGVLPRDGTMVGGVDSNGVYQFISVGTDGKVNVTSYPSGTPMPITATTPIPATTAEKQYTGVPSTFAIGTTDATVFTLAAGEVGFIQNLDDAALAVKKGASASTTSLSFILAAGTAADDGKGGAIVIKDWVGAVSVAAMTGSPRYAAWKQAP